MKNHVYNGSLTREQFLFFETRVVASLHSQGLSHNEIIDKIYTENLFQFPTERMVVSICRTCFKRLDALGLESLVDQLANASVEVAKQINLYAMMRHNQLVWDFMTMVIGEKYRTQELDFSPKDLHVFFLWLQEQSETVISWSEGTIKKIKQVLTRSLVECGYLDSVKSTVLNHIAISPELENGILENQDLDALPAFNCFR